MMLRVLLRLLPRSFREEFGDEMAAVFRQQHRSAGRLGRLLLWVETAAAIAALSARLRLDQVRTDARHAARSLWHQKTFTVTAVTTLALALGPATAVMSLVSNVLLDPLPGAVNVDRVVSIYTSNPERNRHEFPWSELNFLDHRERQQGLAAFGAIESTSVTIGGDVPQQVSGAWVSADMFDVLGISPARGRRFTEADMQPGAPPTLIVADHFAAARFPGVDPLGQTLVVDGAKTTIIGVLPRGFRFPEGEDNFWQPLVIDRATSSRGQTYLHTMGRLADGVTIEQVEAQMNAVAVDLEKTYPAFNAGTRVEIKPAAGQLTRNTRTTVSVLAIAAAAVLLLACTNIASLLIVRASGRRHELAVRTALGASPSRLSRQLLVEHLLVAAIGAVAAVFVAAGLLRLLALTRLVPAEQLARATLGPAALAFLVALAALMAGVIGWIVARRSTTTAAIATGSARTQSSARETVRLRNALVGIEVGAAVVLLVAAGLLIQSAARLIAVDPGFRTDRIVTFQVGLPMSRYREPASRVSFIEAVVERLRQLPDVEDAASGAYGPMGTMRATRRFAIDGQPLPEPGAEPLAIDLPASPGYARLMGLRVVDGRWIDEHDRADSPPVVVISQSFARQFFPNERAVGRRLRYYGARPNVQAPAPEIVGVVSDVRQFNVSESEAPQMYVPHTQRPWTFSSFFVRTSGDPRAVIAALPAAIREVDPERPIERVRTLTDLVDGSTADRRALGALVALAAIVAVLIATIGVYGVTASTTLARRRELAIRAAIGADRTRLIRLVTRQGAWSAGIGVAAGVSCGLSLSSILQSVLYEVPARDPWTFVIAGLGLFAVCAAAAYIPARRAVSDNPALTLNEPA